MPYLSPLLLSTGSLLFCLVLLIVFVRQKYISNHALDLLQNKFNIQELLLSELQTELQDIQNRSQLTEQESKAQQIENEQVSKQLEHRIKTLQQQVSEINHLVEQLNHQQPEDKLYSRAFKLVELGADIEEIIRECEIPRAEAEILLSVHKRKNSQ